MGLLLLHLPGLQHAVLRGWREVSKSHAAGAISHTALLQQDVEVRRGLELCDRVNEPGVLRIHLQIRPDRIRAGGPRPPLAHLSFDLPLDVNQKEKVCKSSAAVTGEPFVFTSGREVLFKFLLPLEPKILKAATRTCL